jgi:hypothetical protein
VSKKAKKATKSFTVEIKRTTIEGVSFEVEAANEDEARDKAFEMLETGEDACDWDLQEDDKEVTDIYLTK